MTAELPDGYCDVCHELSHSCWRCHDQRFVSLGGKATPCPSCSGARPTDGSDLPSELDRMRIPTIYRKCTVETWQPSTGQPRRRAEEFVASWPPANPMMLFTGGVGNGKTHLACGLVRAVFELHGKRGQFWPTIALLDRYKATFNDDTAMETAEQIDAQLRRCEVLVLDDFGTESATPFAMERLFRVVNERYTESLPLVVTSNVALSDLHERVRSRMKSGVICYFDGADQRGRTA